MTLESIQECSPAHKESVWVVFIFISISIHVLRYDKHFEIERLKVIIPEQNLRSATEVAIDSIPDSNFYQEIVLTRL